MAGCVPTAAAMSNRSSQHRKLAALRRVRDRLDRDHRQPLDVEALARAVGIPPRVLSTEFEVAYGRSPYRYLVARRAGSARLSLSCCTTSQEKEKG